MFGKKVLAPLVYIISLGIFFIILKHTSGTVPNTVSIAIRTGTVCTISFTLLALTPAGRQGLVKITQTREVYKWFVLLGMILIGWQITLIEALRVLGVFTVGVQNILGFVINLIISAIFFADERRFVVNKDFKYVIVAVVVAVIIYYFPYFKALFMDTFFHQEVTVPLSSQANNLSSNANLLFIYGVTMMASYLVFGGLQNVVIKKVSFYLGSLPVTFLTSFSTCSFAILTVIYNGDYNNISAGFFSSDDFFLLLVAGCAGFSFGFASVYIIKHLGIFYFVLANTFVPLMNFLTNFNVTIFEVAGASLIALTSVLYAWKRSKEGKRLRQEGKL